MAHDIDHTGQNNAFHVATSSELALRYSDQSVLEMHHLASAFQLLRDPDVNLIGGLPDEAKREVPLAFPPALAASSPRPLL